MHSQNIGIQSDKVMDKVVSTVAPSWERIWGAVWVRQDIAEDAGYEPYERTGVFDVPRSWIQRNEPEGEYMLVWVHSVTRHMSPPERGVTNRKEQEYHADIMRVSR